MTKEQLDAIRARHNDGFAPRMQDAALLLDEVERLTNDLAMARQVSGELCEACGWAMKFPGEPCRCELLAKVERLHADPLPAAAWVREVERAAFRRGSDAMQKDLANWADMAYAKALTSDAILMLPHASPAPDPDPTGDRAFAAIQPSLGTPVPRERRIRRQADVDAAFARGAEAMREAAAKHFEKRALQQRVAGDSIMAPVHEASAQRVRALPIPDAKP